jgi:phosphoribosylglycinamide formyltransferase-1
VAQQLKIAVLISGSGSNLQAIIDAIAAGTLHATIQVVISSRPDAYGLTRAKQAGIPTVALSHKNYPDAAAFDRALTHELLQSGAEWVVMAGYMRLLTSRVLDAFPNRVLNLHPALLPAFKGAHAIRDAFEAGVATTGVTVHIANEEYDCGPILAQREVPILPDDTLEALEERIHATEHELYPQVLVQIAAGRLP